MHLLNDLEKIDIDLLETLQTYPAKIGESIENYRFREALGYLMELSSIGNKSISKKMNLGNLPKILQKSIQNRKHLTTCLATYCQLSLFSRTFLASHGSKAPKSLRLGQILLVRTGKQDLLITGQEIQPIGLLFEKIEDKAITK
jgi:methionyl-tRNA synthetase